MHIAMVSETYPPEVNGVARTVARTVEGLLRRGHRITLVRPRQNAADRPAMRAGYTEVLRPGIPIPRYARLRFGMPARRALANLWLHDRPDVVHISTEGPLGWSALGAAQERGLPIATDLRTNFRAYSAHYGVGWLARLVDAYLRNFHNRAHCTMVPTDELATALAAMRFERLRVVGRGVDSAVFSPAKRSASLRAQWGAGENTPVALCVSRFAAEKNFPLVLAAYRAMVAAQPATRLVLVGDGPLEGELRAAGLGCVVAGRLGDGELSAHYASADIFLFPSITETFGNVTLEAMASGLAVVACDYAAARQHIRHRQSGLLVPCNGHTEFIDQAVLLARDLPLARELGRAARKVAIGLGWDQIVSDFERVLQETAPMPAMAQRASHVAA